MKKSFYFTVILASAQLLAQTDRANLTGTVTDPSGAVVAGASVTAVTSGTAVNRSTETNSKGIYFLSALPLGSYRVTIRHPGFRTAQFGDVTLSVGQTLTQDARLEVAAADTSIEVLGSAAALERSSAEVSGVIEAAQIKEIPVSGRNWASLMALVPGAINYGDGAQRSIRFNGHSLDDSNFTFDGIDTSGVQEQTQKADTRLNIALDAIAEFRVSTAVYTAESGAAGGAQVNVVSKTGTNSYHGSTFYAVRNDALDSRSPFDGAQIPPFTLHQFGASLGGPIRKDRLFFFANYEGLRQSLGRTFINFVPNAAFRSKALATSPGLKPILDAYPLGQTPVDDVTDQVAKVSSDTIREDAGMFRLDFRYSDKTTMFARYNVDNAYIDNPTDALGSRNVIPHIPSNVVLQIQHIFSPRTVTETKFGLNRADYHNWNYGTSPLDVSPGPFDSVSGNSLDTDVGTTLS